MDSTKRSIKEKARLFLQKLIDASEGDIHRSFRQQEIGDSVDQTKEEVRTITTILRNSGCIKGGGIGGMVSITDLGIAEAKTGLSSESTLHDETDNQWKSLHNLDWPEVVITFVSNNTVRIAARGLSRRYDYAELGMKDGRKILICTIQLTWQARIEETHRARRCADHHAAEC